MSDFSPELRRELLDDFYAECDELLTAIRDGLANLEGAAENATLRPKIVEGLFRNTHSLKGISAIVGLRQAEELAHAMEEVLRSLTKRDLAPTEALIDQLLEAAQRLEKIAVAHRLSQEIPDTRALVERLQAHLPAKSPVTQAKAAGDTGSEIAAQEKRAATHAADGESTISASATGAPATQPKSAGAIAAAGDEGVLVKATFSPSGELDKRGVNVTSVRKRLGEVGEIVSAAPLVRGKGVVVFEFVVRLREKPASVSEWESDGVVFVPLDKKPATAEMQPLEIAAAAVSGNDAGDSAALTPSHIVRVDLARLDDLMRITGELVIHRSRLDDRLQQNAEWQVGLKDINLAMGRSLREMREAISRARLVPIAELFTRMPFIVRDLMRGSAKKAAVVLEGSLTEVDKYLVERFREPLLHLVRNAFAHGIETTAERVAGGKAPEAKIHLRARSAGESVILQIRDDGRGVDANAVLARAKSQGLAVPAQPDAKDLLRILCEPGFSTRDQADLAAGRGVGMAVVEKTVRELGGSLTLETWPGLGTEFTLRLPLTVSIANAIIVHVSTEQCAIPQSAVSEIIQAPAADMRAIQSSEVIPYRDGLLPLVRLRTLFKEAILDEAILTVVVVSTDRGAVGLVVDRVRGQREIVIRPLADPLLRVSGIAGATELGDGRPILILDANVITQGVVRPPTNAGTPNSKLAETSHA